MGWINWRGWLDKKNPETRPLMEKQTSSQSRGIDSLFTRGVKRLFAGSDWITGSAAVVQTFSGLVLNFLYFAQFFDELVFEPALELEPADKLFIELSLPAVITGAFFAVFTSTGAVYCHTHLNKQFQDDRKSLEEHLVDSARKSIADFKKQRPGHPLEENMVRKLLLLQLQNSLGLNEFSIVNGDVEGAPLALPAPNPEMKTSLDHLVMDLTHSPEKKIIKIGGWSKFFLVGDALEHVAEFGEVPIILVTIILHSMGKELDYGGTWGVFLAGTVFGVAGSLAEIRNCFSAIKNSELKEEHHCSHHHH